MRIFIDESGNFIVGGDKKRTCCVAALVVPHATEAPLCGEFEDLRSRWTDEREIKGSALSNEQMSSVLALLGRHDVIVIATAFDVGYQSPEQLETFRQGSDCAGASGLIPDYLLPHLPDKPAPGRRGPMLNRILRENIAFPDSRDEPGLQLADAVASAITKAMNGKLPAPVWRLLGPLLLQRSEREPVVRPVIFGTGPAVRASDYHQYVLRALTNRCKPMLASEHPLERTVQS